MPRLVVRGIEDALMCSVSASLVEELAKICECDKSAFTIELLDTRTVCDGVGLEASPFIEVAWFDRGQEARNRFAGELTRQLAAAGVPQVDIAFVTYKRDSFYRQGKPLA